MENTDSKKTYNMVTLVECHNPVEAGFLAGLLEDKEIFFQKIDEHTTGLFQGMGVFTIKIRVLKEDYELAKEIISLSSENAEEQNEHSNDFATDSSSREQRTLEEENKEYISPYRITSPFKWATAFAWLCFIMLVLMSMMDVLKKYVNYVAD